VTVSPRVLGVLGTLVRDRIYLEDEDGAGFRNAWGGIGYALEALAVSLPEGWELSPLVPLGDDLADVARSYLSGIPRVNCGAGLVRAAPRHPRVELRYRDGLRVSERISHIPPAWEWPALHPLLEKVDALYVNLITGWELSLETALRLREHFTGPIYADLHSLFLALDPEGRRSPRRPPHAERWMGAFHAVQVNEQEFRLLAGDGVDPWAWAMEAVDGEPSLLVVTMEDRGAGYVVAPGFRSSPRGWVGTQEGTSEDGGEGPRSGEGSRSGKVVQRWGPSQGDSTGCGDVWGSTLFARLLAGDELESAMDRANRNAALKLGHTGADGLARYLYQSQSASASFWGSAPGGGAAGGVGASSHGEVGP